MDTHCAARHGPPELYSYTQLYSYTAMKLYIAIQYTTSTTPLCARPRPRAQGGGGGSLWSLALCLSRGGECEERESCAPSAKLHMKEGAFFYSQVLRVNMIIMRQINICVRSSVFIQHAPLRGSRDAPRPPRPWSLHVPRRSTADRATSDASLAEPSSDHGSSHAAGPAN